MHLHALNVLQDNLRTRLVVKSVQPVQLAHLLNIPHPRRVPLVLMVLLQWLAHLNAHQLVKQVIIGLLCLRVVGSQQEHAHNVRLENIQLLLLTMDV